MPPSGGYLYQRGDTWWARVRIAGREYRSTLRTGDRREAARRLKAWQATLQRQSLGIGPPHPWEEAVARWAEEVLPGAVKPAVAARYLSSIRQLAPDFEGIDITAISGPAIADYIGRRTPLASNATIRRDLTALSRLLAACVAWGWRADNPARLFDRSLIRERRDPIHPPNAAAIERVLGAAPIAMAQVLRALDQSGMREMEAVTLDWSQVDWRARTVTLLQTKTSRPRVLRLATPGGDLGTVLEAVRAPRGPVFRSERGTAYSRAFSAGVGRVMRDLLAADPDFRRWRVHDLRHGFAIRWLRGGGDIYELSRHLGHASVKTTEGYLGYVPARRRAQTGAHASDE